MLILIDIFSHKNDISLSQIMDMIQNDYSSKTSNKEVNQFLNKIFGDFVQFCDPERKNKSLLL